MNFRSRELLDLAYHFDCQLQIPGVCEGGTGEPCHANWPWAGKGMGMKADDCFVVPGCRACHRALDQGSQMSHDERVFTWLRAFGRYLPALFERGLIAVTAEPIERAPRPAQRDRKRRASRCATDRALPRRY